MISWKYRRWNEFISSLIICHGHDCHYHFRRCSCRLKFDLCAISLITRRDHASEALIYSLRHYCSTAKRETPRHTESYDFLCLDRKAASLSASALRRYFSPLTNDRPCNGRQHDAQWLIFGRRKRHSSAYHTLRAAADRYAISRMSCCYITDRAEISFLFVPYSDIDNRFRCFNWLMRIYFTCARIVLFTLSSMTYAVCIFWWWRDDASSTSTAQRSQSRGGR